MKITAEITRTKGGKYSVEVGTVFEGKTTLVQAGGLDELPGVIDRAIEELRTIKKAVAPATRPQARLL